MKIQVAIVSEQILANLIPALVERPDKVVLASSAEMSQRKLDRRLTRLLEGHGIAVEMHDCAPALGMLAIHAFARKVCDSLVERHADAEIVLNATGGTKPMSLGFVEAFRGIASRIIYTDTQHRRIESLPRADEPTGEPEPMRDVLDVPHYLAAQGLSYSSASTDSPEFRQRMLARKAAAKYLARNAPSLESFIRSMNALADKALDRDGNLVAPVQSLYYPPDPRSPWAEAMRQLAAAKCFGWTEGESEVVFIDAERTRFVRGGWLEEYAFHVLHDERLFDTRLGVEVIAEGGEKARNEFDVLACHGNQLLLVECKTVKFEEGRNDSDLAYKLKSLGESARGLFGETWLLSAQSPTPILVERARQARIRLFSPNDLPKLREAIRQWIAP